MSKSIVCTAVIGALGLLAAADLATARNEDPASFRARPFEARRSLFSGNETMIGQVGWLRQDCSIATPDIRIVAAPKKGSIRFEDTPLTVTASKRPLQKKCYGKPVNAVQIYYRAGEKSLGRDKIVLDVDTKVGGVLRQTYLINVEQQTATPSARPKPAATTAEIGINLPETRLTRSVFSGNEVQIAAFNFVNADCSSGPRPDLRIVTPPAHGAYRLEETTIQVDRKPDNPRASCNGKPVGAVAVIYKPEAEFTGNDGLVVDVDFRNGSVRRYVYAISVR